MEMEGPGIFPISAAFQCLQSRYGVALSGGVQPTSQWDWQPHLVSVDKCESR